MTYKKGLYKINKDKSIRLKKTRTENVYERRNGLSYFCALKCLLLSNDRAHLLAAEGNTNTSLV